MDHVPDEIEVKPLCRNIRSHRVEIRLVIYHITHQVDEDCRLSIYPVISGRAEIGIRKVAHFLDELIAPGYTGRKLFVEVNETAVRNTEHIRCFKENHKLESRLTALLCLQLRRQVPFQLDISSGPLAVPGNEKGR